MCKQDWKFRCTCGIGKKNTLGKTNLENLGYLENPKCNELAHADTMDVVKYFSVKQAVMQNYTGLSMTRRSTNQMQIAGVMLQS